MFKQVSLWLCVALAAPFFVYAGTYGSGSYGVGTYAGNPPRVTTQSASSIATTSAVLNGTITNIGTTSPTVRGFVYGTTAAYGATTTDSAGPFSTGAFTATVSSFLCGSTYHFAAYATSANGSGYGSDASLTTSDCPAGSPPSVAISAPSNGATVSGASVTLSADASDATAVAGVRFYVNGVQIGSEDTSSPFGLTWDSTATSSEVKTLFAVARNSSNLYATSSVVSFTVDNTPPVISSVTSNPGSTSAVINWTTDEAASSKVVFGQTASYGLTASNASAVTTHSITLSGLSEGTTYHFAVVSTDPYGNAATSSDVTLTTTVATVSTPSTPVTSGGGGGGGGGNGPIVGYTWPSLSFGDSQSSTTTNTTTPSTSSVEARIAQLRAQVVILLAKIAALTGNASAETSGAGSTTSTYVFTRDLQIHMTGSDVKALQVYLNTHGFSIATTGPGSSGNETSLFGAATYRALVSFQKAHGLPATGFFGPATRALVSGL